MRSNFIFLGLIHVKILQDQRKLEQLNIVKIQEYSDEAINTFLQSKDRYYEQRQQQQNFNWPFITSLQKKPEYLIVLRREANQSFLNQIKLEEYIIQNLPNDCSEQEWRNQAIQILLTWNLAERNFKVSNFSDEQEDQASKSYAKYSLIYLALAILSFIVINILKNFI
ncbi:unnamed protein product [Paramecium sonneborni]|uniref:Transmembrane protein n=1 Tax=Paramecium sonneborni TaxID=65129 RepID=A0A8S1N3J8_9CILI|nr:unnamed protein product [Paramecium sonneborni]